MAMPPSSRRPRQGLTWLLWLALVLPIAQSAALWHTLAQHDAAAGQAQSAVDGKQAPHATHCDLCLAAAGVTGVAPMAAVSAVPLLRGTDAAAPGANAAPSAAAAALGYQSRAPPLA